MKRKPAKELLGAVANMASRLMWWHPLLTVGVAMYLGFQGVDMYKDYVKQQELAPRQEYSQQMMNDIVTNGQSICDPARSRPGAEAELRAALERKMFIVPDTIGNNVDKHNMRNAYAMEWAKSVGVKLCVDTQMEQGTAIIWHPNEKILAVNGGYHMNLLATHLEVAIDEIYRRGSNDRYRHSNGHNPEVRPLSEKFAVATTPDYPGRSMVKAESDMSAKSKRLSPPIRKGPTTGS